MVRRWLVGAVAGWLLFPAGLEAEPSSRVYLNGAPVRDARGLRLKNVDVEIDQEGNVRIVTRGAGEVAAGPSLTGNGAAAGGGGVPASPSKPAEAAAGRAAPGGPSVPATEAQPASSTGTAAAHDRRPLEERYWIATQDLGELPAGWVVDVELNQQRAGSFASGEPRVVEVTSFLHRGENVVRLVFRRPSGDYAPTGVGTGTFQLILAPGTVLLEQDSISLAYPILSAKRGASDDAGAAEELRFILPPPVRP